MMEGGLLGAAGLDDPAVWILVSTALLAASGLIAHLFRGRPLVADRLAAGLVSGGSVLGLAGTVASLIHPSSFEKVWWLPWGRFFIAVDGLSAAFLFPTFMVVALASIYGLGYWPARSHPGTANHVRICLGFLASSLVLLLIARDAVLFLIAFEVMTLAVFFLVATEHEKKEAREAAWMYLAASHVSFILLLAVFNGLRLVNGGFDLVAISPAIGSWTKNLLFFGSFLAFGVKAGVMPLHVWLPGAHASAPSHVSAVLSGVVIKAGIYAILRILMMLPDPPAIWGVLLLLLGAVSGVAGVVYAIGQHDLKRLLAYHSIENIGIIVMGMGLAVMGQWAGEPLLVVLGLGAALLHVWNHALFKSLLFLSAGSAIRAAGTREIDRMGGLARTLPWTVALFALGAAAICGLPPLNGFISEFILYTGALQSFRTPVIGLAALIAPVLAVIGALACACFIKVLGTAFLGLPRTEEAPDGRGECGWPMRGPMVALALLCVVLGLAPILSAPVLDAAIRDWTRVGTGQLPSIASCVPFPALALPMSAVLLVSVGLSWALIHAAAGSRRVQTWSCGFLQPSSRMQYTSSSFARILIGLTRALLYKREHIPAVQGPHPAPTAYHGHVDDLVLERWLLPAARWFAERSARIRHRQSARIQAYITYIAVAMLGLLLLMVPILDVVRRLLSR